MDVILSAILLFNAITLVPSQSLSLEEVHLVRCLTHISHRYFTPGRSLVISSPSTYRDVEQELIAEIHRTAIWPVVVTVDGNISTLENTDFIHKDGSYIILIQDGNFNSIVAEIHQLALGRIKLTRFWNSDARFVVAGTNELSMSQQIDIFHLFSQLRIYNCIIVSREHYIIDKEHSISVKVNDVDTGMNLVVYTWFPYQSSDRCTEVNNITLLDSWVISVQGHFSKNTDLFPRKISKRLNGCPMKAVVSNGYSIFTTLFMYDTNSNGRVIRDINGLDIGLLGIALQQMNMTFDVVATLDGGEGSKDLYTHIYRQMIAKEVYIYLGNMATHKYEYILPFFDATNIYNMMSVCWYVPCFDKFPRWSSIYRILSVELWLVLILSIVIVAISITLFGRYSCTSELQGYKTLANSLTNVWAVILGVSVSTMPRAPSLRSLFLAWVCFSLVFKTVFHAFVTTYLIDSGYKTPIQTMDELLYSGMNLAYDPEYNSFFENDDDTVVSNVRRNQANCQSIEVCVDWAKNHKNVSILFNDFFNKMCYDFGCFDSENSKPFLCRLQDGVFITTGLVMLMFSGDPLLKRVTEIFDRVVEAGIYKYWNSRFMHLLHTQIRRKAAVHPLDEYYSFNFYHMQPAFYLLLMGWCLSVFCFVIEVLCDCLLRKRK